MCQAEAGLESWAGSGTGGLLLLIFGIPPRIVHLHPHSEFVSEERLFRTGCGSTIVCSGLPVHNSTALPVLHLYIVSSGCARHGTAQVGGLVMGVKRSWGAPAIIARDTRARASASCRYCTTRFWQSLQ